MHLYQMYEQVANPNPSAQYYGLQGAMPVQPNWNVRMTPGVTGYPTRGQFSPMTDGSDSSHRASAENTSPSGFMGARIPPGGASTAPVGSRNGPGPGQNGPPQNHSVPPLPGPGNEDDIIEIPKAQQTLYNGEPMGMTPMFAETPSWLTDNTTVQMPIYHRKSSDGLTLRLMVEALSGWTRLRGGIGRDLKDQVAPVRARAREDKPFRATAEWARMVSPPTPFPRVITK
jgi:hypothetical protein